jgi:hypothetical protein
MPAERLDTARRLQHYKSRSSFIGVEEIPRRLRLLDDKEAARVGCLFCNLTDGESLEPFL